MNILYEKLPTTDFYSPQFTNYAGIYADGFGLAVAVLRSENKKYFLTDLFYEPQTCTLDNIEVLINRYYKKYEYMSYCVNNSRLLTKYLKTLNAIVSPYELNISDGIMLLNSMKNKGYFKAITEEYADTIWQEMKQFDKENTSYILNAVMLSLAEHNPYNLNNWLDALVV